MLDQDPRMVAPGAQPASMPGTPGREPVPAPADIGTMQDATPEEQEQYDVFVGNGLKLIYSANSFPKIVDMLATGGDPKMALAQTAVTVMSRLMQSAEQAGQKPSGDVVLHGGAEIFEELADLATKAEIYDFASDPDAMEGALFQAMDMFREVLGQQGMLDQDAARRDMEQLEAMDRDGKLGPMLMELSRNARDGSGKPEQEKRGLMTAGGM